MKKVIAVLAVIVILAGCSQIAPPLPSGDAPVLESTNLPEPTEALAAVSTESPVSTPSFILAVKAGMSDVENSQNSFPYEQVVDLLDIAKVGKLSGVVFHQHRKTLFAVSDTGYITELKTDGTIIQKERIRKKADFEGISYSPETGSLYVIIEGDDVILEISSETLEIMRMIPIDRMFEGTVLLAPEGNGIEGITYVPDGSGPSNSTFYLVNQSRKLEGTDPSIVFEVAVSHETNNSEAKIVRYFSLGVTDLSGIHYDPSSERLFVISDANNLLLEVSLNGQVLHTYPLPGKRQEGITIDEHGFLYIAQDTKTKLLKFRPDSVSGQNE
jgi:uncharacterized protein YjiK